MQQQKIRLKLIENGELFLLKGRGEIEKLLRLKPRLNKHDGIEHSVHPILCSGGDLEIVLNSRHHLPLCLHHLPEFQKLIISGGAVVDHRRRPPQPQAPIVLLHREPPKLLNLAICLHVWDLRPASYKSSKSVPIRRRKQHRDQDQAEYRR